MVFKKKNKGTKPPPASCTPQQREREKREASSYRRPIPAEITTTRT
jgi:hypothetical protein